MNLTGKNIVGDRLSGNGEPFMAKNPAINAALDSTFYEATIEEINQAIDLASESFDSYRRKTGEEKARFLEAIADEIISCGDSLINRCHEETALPIARLLGERTRTVNQLKLFAELLREGSWVQARIDLANPDRKPLPKPDIRSMLKPLGPVGIFGASNFPIAFSVAGGDSVSALAAGCPVVVKAHPAHPGTSEIVGLAIQRAAMSSGMPPGVFSLLQGKSQRVGMSIVNHPNITAIGFTGSFVGGKAIFDAANQRPVPIPVYAEMGSSNPVFILPEALKIRKSQIGKDLIASVSLGVGQFCTNPGLVFFESGPDSDSFIQIVQAEAGAAAEGNMLTEGILGNFRKGIDRLSNTVGVRPLRIQQNLSDTVGTHVFTTTINSFINDRSLEDEIFGPATLLVSSNTKDDLISAARALSGHLTATVHATDQDLEDFPELFAELEKKVGRTIINGYPTGVEVCHSMIHGGPFPATTAPGSTSVGTLAINRFARPVSFQNFPMSLLPDELKNSNPLGIWRLVNGEWTKNSC